MPTTTNNGWTTPADTDLVKNGASAIRTLGNNIDSTLGVYASPGLVKINTTTFSAVASQSINTVFSTTYNYYKIIFDLTKPTIPISICLNSEKAKEKFDWIPKTSIDEGIIKTLNWYKNLKK